VAATKLGSGNWPIASGGTVPDPDDRHVLAAAIVGGATVIVTFNLKDFPDRLTALHDCKAVHSDEFLLDIGVGAPEQMIKPYERSCSGCAILAWTSMDMSACYVACGCPGSRMPWPPRRTWRSSEMSSDVSFPAAAIAV